MTLLGLLAAVALLIGNALFVAAEFAAVGARRAQIEPLAAGSHRARRTLAAQRRLSLLLAGAQLGITLCSLGLGAIAEPTVARLFESALHAVHLPADLADPLAFAVALALVVLAHMVLGEMVPKNLALAGSERAAVLLVPALDTFIRIAGPLLRVLNAMANGALRLMGVQPQDELKTAYTPDELADILAESRREGLLAAGEHDRLARALAVQQRTAADVLIPLEDLVTVTRHTTAPELETLAARTGFSRFPVVDDGEPDRLLGFVHVKDLLTTRGADDDSWAVPPAGVRPMPSIAAGTPLPDVLTTLRLARSHFATVVADGRVGVVTLEDVLEEITGGTGRPRTSASGRHR